MSYENDIAALDELLLLGEQARYLSWLKRLIEKLKNSLQVDLSDLLYPKNPPKGPLFEVSDISRFSSIILPVVESHMLSSGDGDGAPAKSVVFIKKELLDFHQQEAKRLQNEISRFEK